MTRRTRSEATENGRADKQQPPALPADETPNLFETAGHQAALPKLPDLKAGFKAIARRVYDEGVDVEEEYRVIEDSLTVRGAVTPGALAEAANHTEAMARRAYRLYLVGRLEVDAYMRETEAILGAMRDAAVAALEKEKSAKIRTKQITDADVVSKCAQLYPDEWRTVNDRRERAKGMVKSLENLHELATSRCRTVARMMNPTGRL